MRWIEVRKYVFSQQQCARTVAVCSVDTEGLNHQHLISPFLKADTSAQYSFTSAQFLFSTVNTKIGTSGQLMRILIMKSGSELSGSSQAVISCLALDRQLSEAVFRQSSGSCQAVAMQLSGSHQAVIRQSSGSRQAVVRQSPCSCQAVIRQSSGSLYAFFMQSVGIKLWFVDTSILSLCSVSWFYIKSCGYTSTRVHLEKNQTSTAIRSKSVAAIRVI